MSHSGSKYRVPQQAWPETAGPRITALARHDPETGMVTLVLDTTTASIAMFALAAHADDREAHIRKVEQCGVGLPEGSYGRRNRQAIAARETRVATLVRHHLDAYDGVMAGQVPAERELTEGTLAGLRFVRNRIGDEADLAEFIEPGDSGPDSGDGHVTGWTWKPVPEPELTSPVPRGQAWQMIRYQAYQAQLAGRTIGETFARAAAFLKLAVAGIPALTDANVHAPR